MQITAVDAQIVHVNHRGDWVFVLIHTDAGITGVGEASHGGNDALVVAALEHFARDLVQESPA